MNTSGLKIIEKKYKKRASPTLDTINKGRKEKQMNFTLEDLIDLESARIANAEIELEEREELEAMLQSCGDLPGQTDIFGSEDDYPY